MRHLITAIAIAAAGFAGFAQAQDDAAAKPKPHRVKALTPEQDLMNDCAGQSEAKPREERQAFIKDCVAGITPAPAGEKVRPKRLRALSADQQKMSDCAAQAAELTRDERVAFVKKCDIGAPMASDSGPKVKPKRLKTLTPEQEKESACAAQAAGKNRDERVAAVKECMAK